MCVCVCVIVESMHGVMDDCVWIAMTSFPGRIYFNLFQFVFTTQTEYTKERGRPGESK